MVEKLGLREEGFYERYLDIDGAWRDHLGFAITVEELRRGHDALATARAARAAVVALGTAVTTASTSS